MSFTYRDDCSAETVLGRYHTHGLHHPPICCSPHHGRRLTGDQFREVITRVARDAELLHTAGHQLRQAYATSMPASA
jgi:site-specific recombinase XerD